MHDVLVGDEAVAGVGQHRRRDRRLPAELPQDRRRRHLRLVVRHVTGLRHPGRDLDRVAQHVDALAADRLVRQEVDLAPAVVRRDDARRARDAARAVRGNDVQHARPDVVGRLELRGLRREVDVGQHVVRPVLDDALVEIVPGLLEQPGLRRDVGVAVEHEHLRLRLRALEVPRDLARPLVGTGRAAIGRDRDRERVDAAVGHRLELAAQQHRLLAGLPGVRDDAGRAHRVRLVRRDRVPHELDARREHEAVVRQAAAAGGRHDALVDVDAGRGVAHDVHAPAARQVVVGNRHVVDRLAAADHEVRDRARDERLARLDQRHVDGAVAPHPQVLRAGGSGVAAADHHHLACGAAAHRRAARQHGRSRGRAGRAQEITSLHRHGRLLTSPAARRTSPPSARSARRCIPSRAAA